MEGKPVDLRTTYEPRERYYFAKFMEELVDQRVAQELGLSSFVLLASLARVENGLPANRKHNPDFWADQLCGLCGFGSKHTLIAARQKCIDAGWLLFDPGDRTKPGVYRVEIACRAESARENSFAVQNLDEKAHEKMHASFSSSLQSSKEPPTPLAADAGSTNGKSPSPRSLSSEDGGEGPKPKRKRSAPSPNGALGGEVWAIYHQYHPRAVLDPKRRKLIAQRLEEGFSVEALKAAIHGNHRDPYCNGQNEHGKEYHSLELILRDGDHIERYAGLTTTKTFDIPEPEDPF